RDTASYSDLLYRVLTNPLAYYPAVELQGFVDEAELDRLLSIRDTDKVPAFSLSYTDAVVEDPSKGSYVRYEPVAPPPELHGLQVGGHCAMGGAVAEIVVLPPPVFLDGGGE